MQASESIPGEHWPHAMSIRITDDFVIEELLYARSALHLGENGVPPVFPIPDVGNSRRPDHFDLARADMRWQREWASAWQRICPSAREVRSPTAEMQHLLDTTPDDDLWEAINPSPPWGDAIDRDACGRWRMALHRVDDVPLALTPERLALPALVSAWRSGLTTVVTVPFAGYFAVRTHPSHLIVSYATRDDPELYRRALQAPLA
jgi:hypothetical protein